MIKTGLRSVILAFALVPALASAQFSDSYNFLKAVKDRDGNKATEIISKPGSVIIDTKDASTGEAALHIVTKRRDRTWIAFLLSKGARPDTRDREGNTPLMLASQIGFAEAAQLLLARKAQPDIGNNGGETPLIRSVQLRDATMVRLLLEAGANPNKADRAGLSAMDHAKRDPRATIVLKMLQETKPKTAKPIAGPK